MSENRTTVELLAAAWETVTAGAGQEPELCDALRAVIEAAAHLAAVIPVDGIDHRQREYRLAEAYSCARAAVASTRFAIVAADDARRERPRCPASGTTHRNIDLFLFDPHIAIR